MDKQNVRAPQFTTVIPGVDMPFAIGEVVISTRSWTRFVIADIIFGVTNAMNDIMLVATDGRALEPTEAIRTGNFCELDASSKPIVPPHEDDVISTVPDATLLPHGFVRVDDALPELYRPVLGLRPSGLTSSRYEVITCHVAEADSLLYRWRCHGNDSVLDSGANIIGWRYADDWLMPAQ